MKKFIATAATIFALSPMANANMAGLSDEEIEQMKAEVMEKAPQEPAFQIILTQVGPYVADVHGSDNPYNDAKLYHKYLTCIIAEGSVETTINGQFAQQNQLGDALGHYYKHYDEREYYVDDFQLKQIERYAKRCEDEIQTPEEYQAYQSKIREDRQQAEAEKKQREKERYEQYKKEKREREIKERQEARERRKAEKAEQERQQAMRQQQRQKQEVERIIGNVTEKEVHNSTIMAWRMKLEREGRLDEVLNTRP